jgi:hypothetical protein
MVSRRAARARIRLTVTANFDGGEQLVCRTRDVSEEGLFLETKTAMARGLGVSMSLLDSARGEAIEVRGEVARVVPEGLGIHLSGQIPEAWMAMVDRLLAEQQQQRTSTLPGAVPIVRRLRVLVVGDDARRRGALALYVKSGWDVRFASDLEGATEALRGFKIDAIIAEHDLGDDRWPALLAMAKDVQPATRRIVRSQLHGEALPAPGRSTDLVHRVVDLDAGLDGLVDALTSELT